MKGGNPNHADCSIVTTSEVLSIGDRDPDKAANAAKTVKDFTGSSHVHAVYGDFSDFADIRRFANDVSQVLVGCPVLWWLLAPVTKQC